MVAIDLESFVPYFGDKTKTTNRHPVVALDLATPERFTTAGLPHISPTELVLHYRVVPVKSGIVDSMVRKIPNVRAFGMRRKLLWFRIVWMQFEDMTFLPC